MLGITRWTPWTELAGLHRDLDSIVGRVFGETVPRQVQATYRHGMLELALPLKESAKPHRIEVKVAPETTQFHAA